MYTKSPPSGSVLSQAIHIFKYCAKGNWGSLVKGKAGKEGFWEKAKVSNVEKEGKEVKVWMKYDDREFLSMRWIDGN